MQLMEALWILSASKLEAIFLSLCSLSATCRATPTRKARTSPLRFYPWERRAKRCEKTRTSLTRDETKGRFCKRVVLANVPLPPPPFRGKGTSATCFCTFKGKITCGRCTVTPVTGVKIDLPKPPFWQPPFCEPPIDRNPWVIKFVGGQGCWCLFL